MTDRERSVIIEIARKDVKKGRISVSLLSNTIRSIQQTAYQLGKSRIEREPSIPGRYPSMLSRELELFFVKAEPGSLTATLEFPEKEASLFPDFPDFAERIAEDMHNVIKGIKDNDPKIIHQCIPNPEYRKRILTELSPIIPPQKADYEISFTFGIQPSIRRVGRPTDDQLLDYIGPVEEAKKEKPKEAVITARCLARIKEDGRVKVLDVLNYELFEELDLRPYRTIEIQWLNRQFLLAHEIACDVRKEDSLVIMEYEPLNIRIYSFSREEAIKDFAEEFTLIWDYYAKENDANLTSDAISLKRILLSLVKEVQQI